MGDIAKCVGKVFGHQRTKREAWDCVVQYRRCKFMPLLQRNLSWESDALMAQSTLASCIIRPRLAY